MRSGDRCTASSRFRRAGLARDCWSGPGRLDAAVTRTCRAYGRFAARYLRGDARRAAKTRSIRNCRRIHSPFASGEFRNIGDRGALLWGTGFDFRSGEYLARDRSRSCRLRCARRSCRCHAVNRALAVHLAGRTKSDAGECTELLSPPVRNQPRCRFAACDFAGAMKITIVLGAFLPVPPVMGGAIEKSWFALAQEFVSRNHDVTIISRALPQFASYEIVDGVRHIRVRGSDIPRSLLWLKILDLFYSLRVRRVLPSADILVTNTFWLPLLVRDSSPGKIYVHVGRYPKGQMRLYGRAARLQTPSSDVADAVKREAPSSAYKVIAIPYPHPQIISAEAPLPLEKRAKIVLYVGRVHPEKGVHSLVEAFTRLRRSNFADWKLIIVGSTDSKEGGGGEDYFLQLQQSAAVARDRIVFRGPIFDAAALEEEFRAARIFAYPSLAARGETFGLAPLEAMTHGCAVLTSDLPSFRDFILPNETGFVFERGAPDPADSLVVAFRDALSDPIRLERIAKAGQLKSEKFSRARVADKFLADFESLTRDGQRTNC